MRPYEIVYIFDPALDQGAVEEKLDTFHTALGGEVAEVDHWGARQLAYPIRKSRSGYYVVVRLRARADALPEFERLLKLDRETLRYLVVSDEDLPTSGESILAAVHRLPDGARDGESEAAGEEEPAEGVAPDAEGAEEGHGEADGAAEEDGEAELVAEEEGGGAVAAEGAADEADADSEGGGEGAADGGEEETGESPGLEPRAGPPEYSGVRGRGRRRDGPPIVRLNYKDVATLSRFLNDQGRILPKRTTRVTARFQRKLGTAVKRARFLGLLPYIRDHGG